MAGSKTHCALTASRNFYFNGNEKGEKSFRQLVRNGSCLWNLNIMNIQERSNKQAEQC